jgi:hypothetical protein
MSDVEKVESPHYPHRGCKLGNPAPLYVPVTMRDSSDLTFVVITISGLYAFAATTLVLSLYNVHARHVLIPNVVVGMALFYGGLAQFLAGMWEFATGNTFGATGGSYYASSGRLPPS